MPRRAGCRTMPVPPCCLVLGVCEVCRVRAEPLTPLSVRTPTGRLIVVTLCRDCHTGTASRLVVTIHR